MSDATQGRLPVFREQARKSLKFLVNSLLTNGEQALVVMAGKAAGNVEQNLYFDAMRELRLKRRQIEERFVEKVQAAFDQLGQEQPAAASRPQSPATPQKPPSLNLDTLGMVRDDLLEETLAVDNIASRASHKYRDVLIRIGRFIAGELGRRRVDVELIPISPQALTRAFMDACGELEVEPRAKLVLARLFARFVIDELDQVYDQCLRVVPAEAEDAPVPAAPAAAAAVPVATEATPEAAWDAASAPLLAPPGRARAMPRPMLDDLLLGLQRRVIDRRKPLPGLNPKAGLMPLEMFALISEQMAETGHTQPLALAADHAETINLVNLLFAHALRDAQVPQPVRRLIRLLQIPVLRAAMRNQEVLNETTHPLRLLLKEIGSTALGWTPPADLGADPFFRRIQALVVRIIGEYEQNDEIFAECLANLRSYLKTEQGRIRLLERHTLHAATGKAEAEAARTAISVLLDKTLADVQVPAAVVEFLRGSWSDALFVIRLGDGDTSNTWQLALETTVRLIALAGGRDGGGFAAIGQGLRRGLQRLGFAEAVAAADVSELERAITRPVEGSSVQSGANGMPGAAPMPTAQVARPAASEEFLQLVDKLAPDTWVEFRPRGQDPVRARLLTKFPKTGQFVFVNREGAKAGEWHRNDLAAMLQQGEAGIVGVAGANAASTPGRWGRR